MTPFAVTRRPVVSIASLVLALAATGCGGGVSQSNYDKIQPGMTQDQVEGILGTGKEQTTNSMSTPGMAVGGISLPAMSGKILTWQDGSKTITVTLKDGKVLDKAESGL